MKITKEKLRKLIQESYKKLQNQQAKLAAQGHGPMQSLGPISLSPSKRYYRHLTDCLYLNGIVSQKGGFYRYIPSRFSSERYILSNNHQLKISERSSWPHGFAVIRDSLYNLSKVQHQKGIDSAAPYGIYFSVTGNPEVDAEFITRLCALSNHHFLRIATKAKGSASVGSWESEIMQGYPHKFIGL